MQVIIYLAWLRHIHVMARSPGWKSHDIDHMFVVITSEHVRHGHMLIEMLHYTLDQRHVTGIIGCEECELCKAHEFFTV